MYSEYGKRKFQYFLSDFSDKQNGVEHFVIVNWVPEFEVLLEIDWEIKAGRHCGAECAAT